MADLMTVIAGLYEGALVHQRTSMSIKVLQDYLDLESSETFDNLNRKCFEQA